MSIREALLALLLTEIVEIAVALFLGYRRPREIIVVFLVNLVTNPSLNYLLFLNDYFGIIRYRLPLILFSELGRGLGRVGPVSIRFARKQEIPVRSIVRDEHLLLSHRRTDLGLVTWLYLV